MRHISIPVEILLIHYVKNGSIPECISLGLGYRSIIKLTILLRTFQLSVANSFSSQPQHKYGIPHLFQLIQQGDKAFKHVKPVLYSPTWTFLYNIFHYLICSPFMSAISLVPETV